MTRKIMKKIGRGKMKKSKLLPKSVQGKTKAIITDDKDEDGIKKGYLCLKDEEYIDKIMELTGNKYPRTFEGIKQAGEFLVVNRGFEIMTIKK